MWNFSWAAAVSVLLAAASAGAQTAKPETAAEAAAAAASAAMERAKRQAAGPMRVILEASKSRRKTAEPDTPTPQPAETISVRAVASRTAAPTALPTAPEAVTRSVGAAQPAPAPVTAPVSAVPAVSAPPGVATQMTLSSAALQGKGVTTPVPGLEGVSGALAAAPFPSSPLALPNLSVGPAMVKLMTRVDPQVAQRLLDDMGRNAIVTVDLNIRADGSVSAVTLVPPSPRGIQRAVVAALELWRFEPLPSDRVHRVQLIFNPEP